MSDSITFQHCAACGHIQYFARSFCARCGADDPTTRVASGEGVVYAASLVMRAPTPEIRAHGPYMIVLVDMIEGFRMMAHGVNDLAIGDRVAAEFRVFVGEKVPFFKRIKP